MTFAKFKTVSGARTAMILAAGYGTRMGELTSDIPKPLLPINGFRIIDVVIRKLVRQGIKRIVVNLHYRADQMKQHLGEGQVYGVELIFSEEPELLGSGGGIANAEEYFGGETILAVNADVFCDLDVHDFYSRHQKAGVIATMGVLPSRNNSEYSLVLFDKDGYLRGFLPKGQAIPARFESGIFTGYQILTPRARKHLSPVNQSIITELYRRALDRGERIKIFPFQGRWLDIGSRERYTAALRQIRNQELDLNLFM